MKSNILNFGLLLVACTLFTFTACTDLEVDEVDSTIIEGEGGAATSDPGELLASLYNDLAAMTDQANIYALATHTSDEMIPPTRGVDWGDNGVWRVMHAHTWDATNSWIVGSWNQLNERVFKATRILASSPSPQQAAEAKFLRAYYMHQVIDYFGQVPFREANEGVDVDPRVLTRAEAFDFVVSDLESAIADLPSVAPTANNTQASKAAANALLARMYVNKGVWTAGDAAGPYSFDGADMDKAAAAVDAITAEGYALDADYFNNFEPTGESEIIFTSDSGSPQNRCWMTLHYSQNPSGWNGFTTLAEFYDLFDANDSRIGNPQGVADGSEFSGIGRGFLIGQQIGDDGSETIDSRTQQPLSFTRDVPLAGAATDKGIRVMKYHPSTFGDTKYRLLRYADAYLLKAEALMRKGDSAGALDMVNNLRSMRGADALGSIDERAMLDERGRELYWEGLRRQDQIRFGTFADTWAEKSVTDPTRVLFPIPSVALASNPNLTQNPGY